MADILDMAVDRMDMDADVGKITLPLESRLIIHQQTVQQTIFFDLVEGLCIRTLGLPPFLSCLLYFICKQQLFGIGSRPTYPKKFPSGWFLLQRIKFAPSNLRRNFYRACSINFP